MWQCIHPLQYSGRHLQAVNTVTTVLSSLLWRLRSGHVTLSCLNQCKIWIYASRGSRDDTQRACSPQAVSSYVVLTFLFDLHL